MTRIAPSPTPAQIKAAREAVQKANQLGITAAQGFCAALVHSSFRGWQQWERGERGMHAAIWELAGIKLAALGIQIK